MLARNLISDTIPPVKTKDPAGTVLEWMGEFKVGQLPILLNSELIGLISEDDLMETDDRNTPVGKVDRSIPPHTYVHEDSHVFDVLQLMSAHRLDVVPVLDDHNGYTGIVTKTDILEYLGMMTSAHEPGGIIVLEVQPNDYSLSEIGRICESNDAKVLSLSITNHPGSMVLHIHLKLNLREISRVIATFERFEYKIAFVFFDTEQLHDYQETYENLLRYLNI